MIMSTMANGRILSGTVAPDEMVDTLGQVDNSSDVEGPVSISEMLTQLLGNIACWMIW